MAYARPRLIGTLLLSLGLVAACGDGEGGVTDSDTAADTEVMGLEGSLEATVAGSPTGKTGMNVTMLPGAYAEYRDTANGERISVHGNIPGTSPDFMVGEQSLRIYLQPYDGPRTYTFGAADGAGGAYAELDDTHVFYSVYGSSYEDYGSGSITITERTATHLIGSFAFTGEDQAKAASVTLEGTFDLPLQADGG